VAKEIPLPPHRGNGSASPAGVRTVLQTLEAIAKVAPKVNTAVEKINALIRGVEQSLTRFGAHLEAAAEVDPGTHFDTGFYVFEPHPPTDAMTADELEAADVVQDLYLCYHRVASGFSIFLRERVQWTDPTDRREPRRDVTYERMLLEAPRDKKLYAVHFLPALLADIARRLQRMAEATDKLIGSGPLGEALDSFAPAAGASAHPVRPMPESTRGSR
jgi:phytoene dehydrogenase-like protein